MHKTARNRLKRAIKAITEWCRVNRHQPIPFQIKELRNKMRGHFCYYGISTNSRSLKLFFEEVRLIWFKWLNRRDRSRACYTFDEFTVLLREFPLLRPNIAYKLYWFRTNLYHEEPDAWVALVRICGGAVRATCGATRTGQKPRLFLWVTKNVGVALRAPPTLS